MTVKPRLEYWVLLPVPSEEVLFWLERLGTIRLRPSAFRIMRSFIVSALTTLIPIGVLSRGRDTKVPEVDSWTRLSLLALMTNGDI